MDLNDLRGEVSRLHTEVTCADSNLSDKSVKAYLKQAFTLMSQLGSVSNCDDKETIDEIREALVDIGNMLSA